jgi:hypothetical protein
VETGILLLLGVAGLWGAFLLPSLFSTRREAPLNSTQEFSRLTERLAYVQGRPSVANRPRSEVLSRRRRAFVLLIGTAILLLILAWWLQSTALLILHVAVDGLIAWYVSMLVHIKRRSTPELIVLADYESDEEHPPAVEQPQVRILA